MTGKDMVQFWGQASFITLLQLQKLDSAAMRTGKCYPLLRIWEKVLIQSVRMRKRIKDIRRSGSVMNGNGRHEDAITMGEFKINFRLQDLDKICLWGREEDLSLHWFGLTGGELWIDAGSQTIYEYSEAARKYFSCPIQYNDYQIARFLEDFSYTFQYIGESIPEYLYGEIGEFEAKTDAWKDSHMDDADAVFALFYDNKYEWLVRWF